MHHATSSPSDHVMITPRVLDQGALDELSSSLRNLIDDAAEIRSRLRDTVDQLRSANDQSNQSTMQLQERLRLSARMLKAFQSQIDRVDAAVASVTQQQIDTEGAEKRLAEALASFESRMQAVVESSCTQIEAARAAAFEQLDQHLAVRQGEVAAVERQLGEARDRAETLTRLVEGAEVNIAVLAHKSGQSARDAHVASVEIEASLEQARQARKVLAQELTDASSQIERFAHRSTELNDTLRTSLRLCETNERQVGERLAGLTAAIEQAHVVEASSRRLDALLQQLAPWEGLLLRGSAEVLPKPLARIVDELRDRLRGDLRALSSAMRVIADRAETMLPGDPLVGPQTPIDLSVAPESTQPELVESIGSPDRAATIIEPQPLRFATRTTPV